MGAKMTTVGTVRFDELWRVKIEANHDGTPGIPGSAINDPGQYDVLAQSMSGAITMALAFYNRGKKNIHLADGSHVTRVSRTILETPILAPTTVAALNYPDVEVQADIAEPHNELTFDNPFGDMTSTAPVPTYERAYDRDRDNPFQITDQHPRGCRCDDCRRIIPQVMTRPASGWAPKTQPLEILHNRTTAKIDSLDKRFVDDTGVRRASEHDEDVMK
jgi:hypothetical protein